MAEHNISEKRKICLCADKTATFFKNIAVVERLSREKRQEDALDYFQFLERSAKYVDKTCPIGIDRVTKQIAQAKEDIKHGRWERVAVGLHTVRHNVGVALAKCADPKEAAYLSFID